MLTMKYLIDDDTFSILREWVKNYIDEKCIERSRVMPGKMPGTRYTWMFYLRRGLFNHEFLSAISQMFIYKFERIYPEFNFQICGLETAATPMVAGIPLVGRVFDLNINSFVVRKEQKQYGLMNWIEGLPNDKPVIIIDDLCNSSTSMARCMEILKHHKIEVLPHAFAIINKSNKGIHSEQRLYSDMYLPPEINVVSLFDLDDFNLTGTSH